MSTDPEGLDLFLAAAHAVAPWLVDPSSIPPAAGSSRPAGEIWEGLRTDDRARQIFEALPPAALKNVRRIFDALCREFSDGLVRAPSTLD